MPAPKVDKAIRKAILDARSMVEEIIKIDANEAETSKRVEYMFEALMGYNRFKHISQEHKVHGQGDADYCDLAIQIDDEKRTPTVLIEVKRASIDLAPKHLKQTASYGINAGCEWAILTNGRQWHLYHISFGQPPQTFLLDSWNLLDDDIGILADKFALVSLKSVKKGGLKQLWEKSNVLTPSNVVKLLLSEESISMVRRGLKRLTDVTVTPEDIVSAIRHLLNESALGEMDKVKICLPEKKPRAKVTPKNVPVKPEPSSEIKPQS